jgi:hypothetical protein
MSIHQNQTNSQKPQQETHKIVLNSQGGFTDFGSASSIIRTAINSGNRIDANFNVSIKIRTTTAEFKTLNFNCVSLLLSIDSNKRISVAEISMNGRDFISLGNIIKRSSEKSEGASLGNTSIQNGLTTTSLIRAYEKANCEAVYAELSKNLKKIKAYEGARTGMLLNSVDKSLLSILKSQGIDKASLIAFSKLVITLNSTRNANRISALALILHPNGLDQESKKIFSGITEALENISKMYPKDNLLNRLKAKVKGQKELIELATVVNALKSVINNGQMS